MEDEYCDECEAVVPEDEGCIHFSPCCGVHILLGTDCCSSCKEHTGVMNT
jgi:hypothetical protein